jgi:hypothetical protein
VSLASRWQERRRQKAAQARLDEITQRAADLGITQDRVLQEYARIAFANLGHVFEWKDGSLMFKAPEEIGEDDVAAIAEIVESAKDNKPYRVKLYDKKAALDAIARYLGMEPLVGAVAADDRTGDNERDDPRAALIRELDRLAARVAEGEEGSGSTETGA